MSSVQTMGRLACEFSDIGYDLTPAPAVYLMSDTKGPDSQHGCPQVAMECDGISHYSCNQPLIDGRRHYM